MAAVTTFSRTAANNNAPAPDGFPEGQTAGSLNNCARELMKAVVDEATNNACKVLASVAGTNTITASATPDITAYSGGMIFELTPANTNTGATTLNVDSLGALPVLNIDGTACVGGELVSGIPALLILYAGANNWVIVNPNVIKSRGLEAGYRDLSYTTQSGNYTIQDSDRGKLVIYQGAGGHTYTFGTSPGDKSIVRIENTGSGSITIAAGAGATIIWLNGAAFPTGSRTFSVGGSATLYNVSTGWRISGNGIS